MSHRHVFLIHNEKCRQALAYSSQKIGTPCIFSEISCNLSSQSKDDEITKDPVSLMHMFCRNVVKDKFIYVTCQTNTPTWQSRKWEMSDY